MRFILRVAGLFIFAAVAAGYCAIADSAVSWRERRRETILDQSAMIEAIAEVESGNNAKAVGAAGERGRCQFKASTWAQYTNAPFSAWAPVDCLFTRTIERAHLSAICRELRSVGLSLDPALIAAAWHHGVSGSLRYRSEDAAERTANLYYEFATAKKGEP